MISAVMVAMAPKGKRRGRPKPNKVPLHLRMDLNDPDIFAEPAPSMLYHYTNAAGLTGIVQSKCRLQATDHQLLNDSDEFKFGRAIAMEVLESLDAVESNVKEKGAALWSGDRSTEISSLYPSEVAFAGQWAGHVRVGVTARVVPFVFSPQCGAASRHRSLRWCAGL